MEEKEEKRRRRRRRKGRTHLVLNTHSNLQVSHNRRFQKFNISSNMLYISLRGCGKGHMTVT